MDINEKSKHAQKDVQEGGVVPAAQRTIPVKVVKLGGDPQVVQLSPEECTLENALRGFSTHGLNVRVNGRKVTDEYKLEEHDIITLLPQIRGGARWA